MARICKSFILFVLGCVLTYGGTLESAGAYSNDSSYSSNGVEQGAMEFTIAGAGTSDKKFDHNVFNLNLSLGKYFAAGNLVGIRQSATANNNQVTDDTDWNGSTRIFYDYNFDMNRWKPFLGLSLGYIYGDTIEESWIGGPELGEKYYPKPGTFVTVMVEYQFLFEDANDADNQFKDGVYIYNLGMGFNFPNYHHC